MLPCMDVYHSSHFKLPTRAQLEQNSYKRYDQQRQDRDRTHYVQPGPYRGRRSRSGRLPARLVLVCTIRGRSERHDTSGCTVLGYDTAQSEELLLVSGTLRLKSITSERKARAQNTHRYILLDLIRGSLACRTDPHRLYHRFVSYRLGRPVPSTQAPYEIVCKSEILVLG